MRRDVVHDVLFRIAFDISHGVNQQPSTNEVEP